MTRDAAGADAGRLPLTLQPHPPRGCARATADAEVVTLTRTARCARASHAEVAERVDRLARALARLGIEQGDRVGTFAWNNQRHLELYFAMPCIGAVLHTLNVRLFAEQLTYIVNHAEDRVIFVDDSLVPLLAQLAPSFDDRRALRRDGRRRRGRAAERAALRGAARAGRAGRASTTRSSTSARRRRSATRAARPATRRACSTRTARSACTPRPR